MTAGTKPNVVFILADDLGYADVSCNGRREYVTANIDRIAAEGIRFTQAYANSAICSPTRTALITGRYQGRLAVGLDEPGGRNDVGLPPEHPTLPSLLRDHGYATALIGKWHLGKLPNYDPLKSGYDEFFGVRSGGADYFRYGGELWDGDVLAHETGYLTTVLGNRAVALIDTLAAKPKPFFVSLHFTAPHWPWEGPDDQAESERIAKKPGGILHYDGGSQATYAQMVLSLDKAIGRALDALDRAGCADNTIVIVTSDNGGERFSDTWPFSGKKGELLEGGLRVPTVMRWPARIAASKVSTQAMMSMDWMPTLLAAVGASPHPDYPCDGMNLMAHLTAGASDVPRKLYWRYNNLKQEAVRDGDWKYLKILDNTFLFNVVVDPLERANLKTLYPEMFAHLAADWQAWNKTMLPYTDKNYSWTASGGEVADHFGAPGATLPARPAPPRDG